MVTRRVVTGSAFGVRGRNPAKNASCDAGSRAPPDGRTVEVDAAKNRRMTPSDFHGAPAQIAPRLGRPRWLREVSARPCAARKADPAAAARVQPWAVCGWRERRCRLGAGARARARALSRAYGRRAALRVRLFRGPRTAAPRPLAAVPERPEHASLPGPPWNLELTFDSPVRGACPLRVEFQPSREARSTGLAPAKTTVLLQNPPGPPAQCDSTR